MTKLSLHLRAFGRRRGQRHDHESTTTAESTLSAAMMEETLATAEEIITKWDPEASVYAKITSLFYENRSEAARFLAVIDELHHTMMSFVASEQPRGSSHGGLIRAQRLMEAAMRRLQKEFYQILAANRDHLDPESVSARSSVSSLSDADGAATDCDSPTEDSHLARTSINEATETTTTTTTATADLRAIADTMINAGYGKECVKIYNILRKSTIEEGLYRLGFEPMTFSQVQKLDWPVLDLRIRSWLGASRAAVRTLFYGERLLLDEVFASSSSIREVLFSGIAGEAATQFLAFPEMVAKASKKSPEKLFRLLDLHDAVADLWPELSPAFNFPATAGVRSQASSTLSKLAEAARAALGEFEALIQKDSSKAPASAAGVHPLTRYTMNYLALLADYESTLAGVFAGAPAPAPETLPEEFLPAVSSSASGSSSGSSPSPSYLSLSTNSNEDGAVAVRLAWLVLVLLCKLDGKAAAYRPEVAASYLFLANNVYHVVNKVRACRLGDILGEKWARAHVQKARRYAAAYERAAWGRVAAAVPAAEVSAGEARERLRAFNAAFEEAVEAQASLSVVDQEMRDEVRDAVVGMIVPAYRGFYERWKGVGEVKAIIRFAPEDVRRRLGELFGGADRCGSASEPEGFGFGFGSDSWPYKGWNRPGSSEGLGSDRTSA